ncbi:MULTISPECIES: DapH/DapD/GlmU-related protein [unclassified Leucobacter]|uniref:DapH/DapD/GlmU-related protein n=1 Tax=unclassified Leucobacter TaxID=2621730 RepID=UPI00165DF412|nr:MULTISPECIES: DapH/DapD/GlmU-related protein [unclassified Leucobacter]MBC9927528.1 acyl-ACP--UDP-N- acetylglucosamine O-acyltransferase [Leucobacter sp. cx-169]
MTDQKISRQAYIGPGVVLGERVTIGPGAVLLGPCVIGDDVYIGAGALLGAPPEMTDQPQNAAWTGDLAHAGVVIGNGAVIREGAVIHQGSYRATTVGARSWILNRVYLAHDVLVGEDSTVSAGVSIGGHCVIGDRVNIGMNAVVHQRTFVSNGCMVGMGTPLNRDLPPFVKAYGSPVRIHGVNSVGLSRAGVQEEQAEALLLAYQAGDLLLNGTFENWTDSLAVAIAEWRSREKRRVARLAKEIGSHNSA